jgi:hypothetical protein
MSGAHEPHCAASDRGCAAGQRADVHGHTLARTADCPGWWWSCPANARLKTNTILTIGEHSVRVEAFVCRKPDENHEGVYRFLLKRNRRLYGVAYTLDNVGDIYLVGRMSLASVDCRRDRPGARTGARGG